MTLRSCALSCNIIDVIARVLLLPDSKFSLESLSLIHSTY